MEIPCAKHVRESIEIVVEENHAFSTAAKHQLVARLAPRTPKTPPNRPVHSESWVSLVRFGALTTLTSSTLSDITPAKRIGSQSDGGRQKSGREVVIYSESCHLESVLTMFDDQKIMPVGGDTMRHARPRVAPYGNSINRSVQHLSEAPTRCPARALDTQNTTKSTCPLRILGFSRPVWCAHHFN